MKGIVSLSAKATLVVMALYISCWVIFKEFPATAPLSEFMPLKLSRAYDLLVIFPFFLTAIFFIFHLKNIEDKDYTLYRKIGLGLVASIMLSLMFGVQISPLAGLITGLSVCFLFGMLGTEFAIITSLAFGLIFWFVFSIKSGLLLGLLPGAMASVVFGIVALIGLKIKNLISHLR